MTAAGFAPEGARLARMLDQTHVEQLWPAGVHVSWETGETLAALRLREVSGLARLHQICEVPDDRISQQALSMLCERRNLSMRECELQGGLGLEQSTPERR